MCGGWLLPWAAKAASTRAHARLPASAAPVGLTHLRASAQDHGRTAVWGTAARTERSAACAAGRRRRVWRPAVAA